MIVSAVKGCRVVKSEGTDAGALGCWLVVHPSNYAILGYCGTEAEARAFARAVDDLEDAVYREAIAAREESDFKRQPSFELARGSSPAVPRPAAREVVTKVERPAPLPDRGMNALFVGTDFEEDDEEGEF